MLVITRKHVGLLSIILIGACAQLPPQPRIQPDYWGFTGPWDPRSDHSVDAHGSSLARVITGWIALDTTSFRPVMLYPDTVGMAPAIASRKTALITTFAGNRFHPEIVRGLGDNPGIAAVTAGSIASLVDSGGYR